MQQVLIQKFAQKVDLTSLKSNVDKLDINLKSNLSNLKSKEDKKC